MILIWINQYFLVNQLFLIPFRSVDSNLNFQSSLLILLLTDPHQMFLVWFWLINFKLLATASHLVLVPKCKTKLIPCVLASLQATLDAPSITKSVSFFFQFPLWRLKLHSLLNSACFTSIQLKRWSSCESCVVFLLW